MAERAFSTITRGDTRTVRFTVQDGESPKDITGYLFFCTLKANEDDPDSAAALQVSTTVGDDARDDAAGGICYLVLPSTATAAVEPGAYFYDLQRVIPGSPPEVKTLESGWVQVKYDATEATS